MRHSPVFRALSSLLLLTALLFLGTSAPVRAEEASGLLFVSATPPGAQVLLDGKAAGSSPLTTVAPAGMHQVRVESPGYESYTRSVEVVAGKKVVVEAVLVRVAGALEVQVNTSDAQVFLEDRLIGKGGTVRVDPLDAGVYTLRVEKPGFEMWRGKITVFRGKTLAVPVMLASAFGVLSVETDPPGARVWVDGKDRGVSPAVVDGLSDGLHGVRLSRDGRADMYQSIKVERQRRVSIRVALPEAGGKLVIRSSPGTPRLFLNGYALGESYDTTVDNLGAGTHSIRAVLPGYADAFATVQVTPGETSEAVLKLFPVNADTGVSDAQVLKPANRTRAIPWIILGTAVAVGAGVGIGVAVDASAAPPDTTIDPISPPDATLGVSLP